MPTLYGAAPSPFVRKVRVVLAEKNIPYEFDPVIPFNVSAEFKKLSPLGKIPAFRDGDRTLADSSVISAYLERTHPEPRLYPADPYEYARALWFEEWADGGLVNITGPKIFMQRVLNPLFFQKPTDEGIVSKALNEELPPFLDYLEGELGKRKYLVGNALSIGDIGVASQFVNLRHAGVSVDTKRWPGVAAFVASIHERPSFRTLISEEAAQLGTKP